MDSKLIYDNASRGAAGWQRLGGLVCQVTMCVQSTEVRKLNDS